MREFEGCRLEAIEGAALFQVQLNGANDAVGCWLDAPLVSLASRAAVGYFLGRNGWLDGFSADLLSQVEVASGGVDTRDGEV